MKIVKVTYTTKSDYVEQNKANIAKVMSDMQKLNHPGIRYHVTLSEDGKTFTHLAFFDKDEYQKILLEVPSFVQFQQALKTNGPETPPKQESPSLVGSSYTIFN